MTTLEMVSSKPASEADRFRTILQEKLPLQEIVDYTLTHSPRLVRPIVSYDFSALALSFVPAAETSNDHYTYHHLRSDLWDKVSRTGAQFGSRYTVPSAHVTIARFAVPPGLDRETEAEELCRRRAELVEKLESINQELRSKDWERFGSPARGKWVVGKERGLELNKGQSWYGKGEAVFIGKGF